jgi:hypothetical protein
MMIDQTVTMLGGEKCRHPPWFESLQNREQRPPKREQLGATLGARRYNAGGRPRNEMPAQSTYVCTLVDFGERPRTPLAEREGFEPPGREPFRFQGGCIWPLCHRSVGHAIPHPLARS